MVKKISYYFWDKNEYSVNCIIKKKLKIVGQLDDKTDYNKLVYYYKSGANLIGFKDTRRGKARPYKTPALTKGMNMNI